MPSVSTKQRNFMAGCAHGMKPNKKGVSCPPNKVAKEYVMADKLRNRGRKHA